jgi:hypothetical protein
MSGRGDNNKHGTSGRGAGNQSNQPFAAKGVDRGKSYHGEETGGRPSVPQKKTRSQASNRNTSLDGRKNNR